MRRVRLHENNGGACPGYLPRQAAPDARTFHVASEAQDVIATGACAASLFTIRFRGAPTAMRVRLMLLGGGNALGQALIRLGAEEDIGFLAPRPPEQGWDAASLTTLLDETRPTR